MTATWYLAICRDCHPVLPQPFSVQAKRDEWLMAHKQGTGHEVICVRQEDEEISVGPAEVYMQDSEGRQVHVGTSGSIRIRTGSSSISFY
jgi:hypothetical protein